MTVTDPASTPLSRAEINRMNASKSTGPRSPAGKARVRFNALKHGMRARSRLIPGESEDDYRARHDAWTADLKPQDQVDRFLVDRAVHASWMLDRAGRAIEARRQAARFADAERLAALAEEVADLGGRLIREPVAPLPMDARALAELGPPAPEPDVDDPARMVIWLEATALGCAWLLERWEELSQLLEDDLPWQPHDRLKAVRMLGKQPRDAVDDGRVMGIYLDCWDLRRRGGDHPIDRAEPPPSSDPRADLRSRREELDRLLRERAAGPYAELVAGLAATERAAYLERLKARKPRRGRDGSPEAARAGLLGLIAGEEERLEAALAGHLEREEAEAIAAESFDGSDWGERLRRYEQSNDRILLRLVQALRKRQESVDASAPAPGDVADAGAVEDAGQRRAGDVLPLSDREDKGLTPPAGLPEPTVDEMPPTIPAPPEPSPIGGAEPDRDDPAPVATIGAAVPAAIDRGEPAPAGRVGRLAATVRRLAGSVLALFALASAAGLPAVSARSSVEPTAASPARQSIGIPARGACRAPTSACWICSSRPPGQAVAVPRRPGSGARGGSKPGEQGSVRCPFDSSRSGEKESEAGGSGSRPPDPVRGPSAPGPSRASPAGPASSPMGRVNGAAARFWGCRDPETET